MRRWLNLLIGVAVAVGLAGSAVLASGPVAATNPTVEISFAAAARNQPVTGRVYVAFSRTTAGNRSPIQETDPTGVPLFSSYVSELKPGAAAVIDSTNFGHPIESLRDLPAGDYTAQAFVNVYTRFPRADGHTVWLHMDQWEGQNWKTSPGNLYGDPVKIHFDPASPTPLRLVADKVIPPIQVPPDTDTVKRIKIQSQILSKWWGQPIYIGATITLPKDYDKHPDVHYPVIYSQGHFSLGAPGGGGGGGGGRGGGRGADAQTPAADDVQPRVIWVSLQHPSPYYDDSYGVNSANNGPFGDAIMQELLPLVETKFRIIREPWARLLTGGSTGGWIALAHQIFYPDFYGGSFALCPDGVDFRYHQIVNIYQDANAYWIPGRSDWVKVERPDTRNPDGNITSMMKDENWHELVVGDHSRGGGQWDIWEATYGPVGEDGYPKPIWDKKTGAIDKSVAEYWKQHYDLRNILETNWSTLGPKLANKINVYVGDADTYFLNMGVHMLDDFLTKADNPKWTGEVVFQPMARHCWGPRGPELFQKMIGQIDKYAPSGADLKSWRY